MAGSDMDIFTSEDSEDSNIGYTGDDEFSNDSDVQDSSCCQFFCTKLVDIVEQWAAIASALIGFYQVLIGVVSFCFLLAEAERNYLLKDVFESIDPEKEKEVSLVMSEICISTSLGVLLLFGVLKQSSSIGQTWVLYKVLIEIYNLAVHMDDLFTSRVCAIFCQDLYDVLLRSVGISIIVCGIGFNVLLAAVQIWVVWKFSCGDIRFIVRRLFNLLATAITALRTPQPQVDWKKEF